MTKRLFLLRHARAENPVAGLADFNRALNERGRKDAQALAAFIRKENLTFDLALCSTALRARETAELVLQSVELPLTARSDQRIYEADLAWLLQVVAEIENDKNAVLLVGHNPGVGELVNRLTGRVEQMATCTLALLTFATDDWHTVAGDGGSVGSLGGRGSLAWIVKPEEF
jgi:phosphohistidine phosphatase